MQITPSAAETSFAACRCVDVCSQVQTLQHYPFI